MVIETDRLIVRKPIANDRDRFVELFTNEEFMIFAGVLDVDAANSRFDHMLRMAETLSFAKQPVVERATNRVIGYTGVDVINLGGVDRLEWGWRLERRARGRGFATEAVSALLDLAGETHDGEMLCLIDPDNLASLRVAEKVGFTWWQRAEMMGDLIDMLTRPIGAGGPPLLAPSRAQ